MSPRETTPRTLAMTVVAIVLVVGLGMIFVSTLVLQGQHKQECISKLQGQAWVAVGKTLDPEADREAAVEKLKTAALRIDRTDQLC